MQRKQVVWNPRCSPGIDACQPASSPRGCPMPLRSLRNVAWSEVSGGIKARTSRPFLHGYIYCNEIISGDLSHSCLHGPGPHSIKVCIVKKDNTKAVFDAIV